MTSRQPPSDTLPEAPTKKPRGRPRRAPEEKLEQFSIRLTPKLKYGLELLARAQHRSISQAVEWALQVGLNGYELDVEAGSLGDVLDHAWGDGQSEVKRLLHIYLMAPGLLTFEERVACELADRSVEAMEILDLDDVEARRLLEDEFHEFCERVWPVIQDVAVRRANAGKTTINVALLPELGVSHMPLLDLFRDVRREFAERQASPEEWENYVANLKAMAKKR